MASQAASSPLALDYAASENPAVARCCEALQSVLAQLEPGGRYIFPSCECAKAYRHAMPSLSGLETIRDFIACTAHGMLIGAICATDGARLLYAAQVARGALDKPSAKAKK